MRPSERAAKQPIFTPSLSAPYVDVLSATRREFSAAAAAAALAALAGCPNAALADNVDTTENADGTGDTVDDAAVADAADATVQDDASQQVSQDTGIDEDGNTNVLVAFTDVIEQTSFQPTATITLPLGCNVYADCETRAAVVQANGSNRPFTVIGCIDYATASYGVVLNSAIAGTAYAPAEARCTDQLIAWIEVDNATDDWAFYAAPFSGQAIDANTRGLVQLGSGSSDWLQPQFAVQDDSVVWQVMPDPSGPYKTSSSHAYRWQLGGTSGVEVCESPGRFACAPSISAGVLTLAPRVKADEGVYYGITAYDMRDAMRQVDQLVLPVAVKPFFATRIGDNFAFSIEANYGYGGLLGSMGYYIGPGSGPFNYVVREPYGQMSYCNGYYIVKSRLSYFVINLEQRTYATIASVNGCVDYGDYPATAGTVGSFVTYAAVKDSSTGVPNGVAVRIFSLV